MKTLIIFALTVLISFSSQLDPDEIGYYVYKFPDDKKIKIGEDVYAIRSYDSVTINTFVYIKKKS